MRRFGLSKSKIAAFEQCPKRLWLQVHRPDEAQIDADTQAKFAAGHEVGALACSLVPGGIMIEADPTIQAALQRTSELIASEPRAPLFEATFERDGVLVRVDVLEPDAGGAWHVAEVKSSTAAKDYQLSDLATQVWVMEGAAVQLSAASIRHIDRTFVYGGEGDYQGLLKDYRADGVIAPLVASRSEVTQAARTTLEGPEPEREPGDHCTEPFTCPFQGYCNRGRQQPDWPISLLPHSGRRLAEKWREQGIVELTDLPEGSLANRLHARIRDVTVSGDTYHDPEGAAGATAAWAFPRTWLDFETIAFAVPRWAGTHPYEQMPFQFSADVEGSEGQVTHHEFLSLEPADPRRACAEALIEIIPAQGAIIAYNASFERARILRLAENFPDLAPRLMDVAGRLVDLQPVAKAHWYHRDQRGSWSIKAVLPTIGADLGYEDLEVADGNAAQHAYVEAISPETSIARRNELEAALRAYCRRDTEAMIHLYRRLVSSDAPSQALPLTSAAMPG